LPFTHDDDHDTKPSPLLPNDERMTQPLHLQHLPAAAPSTKIRLAVLGKALCDALGGPAEFHPRFSFDFVSHMQPNDNFGLPAGVWTDDTSMALALARSIATFDAGTGTGARGGMDAADQLDAYYRWWQEGALSATGRCFDIGNTIQRSLSLYQSALRAAGVADGKGGALQRVGAALSSTAAKAEKREKRRAAAAEALSRIAGDMGGAVFGGNGSLMRVLPVGLAYWRAEEGKVGEYARESSGTTHPNVVCKEACAVWAQCIARVVRTAAAAAGAAKASTSSVGKSGAKSEQKQEGRGMTKLDVLHHFAAFAYTTVPLRKALAADVPLPESAASDPAAMEAHYTAHHRLLRIIAEIPPASSASAAEGDNVKDNADAAAEARTLALLPQATALPSSGYVVDTLAAALYAFLATTTFEAGALLTANMGNDADTVAAVYGGLAGAWYAVEDSAPQGDKEEGLFWSPRVREWRKALVRRDIVEEVAEELAAFAERSS
jgi:ADP-ribosylglycohydrolase